MAESLTRFGASVETGLLEKFDGLIEQKGYGSRSEIIRDLMREFIIENEWQADRHDAIATITLIYDHSVRELSEKLTAAQHDSHHLVMSALHVHLDHRNCLEVIVVKGVGSELQALADRLISAKGVKHGKMVISSLSSVL